MSKSSNQKTKLLHLARMLLRQTDEDHPLTVAAGTAAALCIKHGWKPEDVSLELLQRTLREQGQCLKYETEVNR